MTKIINNNVTNYILFIFSNFKLVDRKIKIGHVMFHVTWLGRFIRCFLIYYFLLKEDISCDTRVTTDTRNVTYCDKINSNNTNFFTTMWNSYINYLWKYRAHHQGKECVWRPSNSNLSLMSFAENICARPLQYSCKYSTHRS